MAKKGVARVGDKDSDPDVIVQGSKSVFAGDRGISNGLPRSVVSGGYVVKYTELDFEAIRQDGQEVNGVPVDGTPPLPGYENKPEPSSVESDTTAPPERTAAIPGCEDIDESTGDGYSLSANYTLAMLSTKCAANSPGRDYRVRAQRGLTRAEIICNLKAVAANILEPLRAKYPSSMVVTSGFRPGSGTSQHEKGQAVDVQWMELNNRSKAAEYYERAKWIRDNLPFDQLLLEYKSRSGYPWIHISFNRAGNRPRTAPNAVMTQRLTSGFDPGLILRRFS